MKELYIPCFISNLKEIQEELLKAIKHDYKENKNPHAFTYDFMYIEKSCPKLMAWLKPRLKVPVRAYRYYVTPPHQSLAAHIDGAGTLTATFGINIPVAGTENTYFTYYETDPDNLEIRIPKGGYYSSTHPKDFTKLKPIAEIELTEPYVINNAVLHGVRNESDNYRVIFTMRWPVHPSKYKTVDEVLDTTGMFYS